MNIRYINADKLYKGLDKAVINNSTRISSKVMSHILNSHHLMNLTG